MLALVLLALVAGCSAACQQDAEASYDHYVALGDSYTSGAGLADEVIPTGLCGQSRLSYPYLVAAELDASLDDASCGGATTQNGAEPQPRAGDQAWPPQLQRLGRQTDLVTVGLGYNDFGFYLAALFGCTTVASSDPTGAPCRAGSEAGGDVDLRTLPPRIGDRVADLLAEVHDRAPDAEVLLVGYPQLVPADGSCPQLPLAAGDYAFVREQLTALDDALRDAAEQADARFVDVMRASEGHDICAGDDAWVSGSRGGPEQAAPYHPFSACQEAVADLVLAELRG